jgi:hypothetical protein
MKKYDIVIARYNEDINWLTMIDTTKYNVKIYNKGENNINFEFIPLENFGRDAHTFLTYIVDNFNNLPEYVIFLQGNPFEHQKNVIDVIKNHDNQPFVCLSDNILDERIDSWYENLVEINSPMTFPNMKRFGLRETANAILGDETPQKCQFAAGQQYIVNKKYILNRDLEFYKNIVKRFEIDFVLPWHIERIWFNIFKF